MSIELAAYKDLVKETVDLRDVFAQSGVELKRVNGGTSKCCCPVHQEKTPSCHVHADYYHCFGCQSSGDVFSWFMDREQMTFMEALQRAGEMVNLPMPQMSAEHAKKYQEKQQVQQSLRSVLDACQVFYRQTLETSPCGEAALEYCNARGWSAEIREQFGIGFAPNDWQLLRHLEQGTANNTEHVQQMMISAGMMAQGDSSNYLRFKGRIMFAVSDARGRLCGFSGRLMPTGDPAADKKKAKYLNTNDTELFDKSSLLFGFAQASHAISKKGLSILVEGQGDVIACHLAGHNTAVAPMGTALTAGHLEKLKRLASKVVLLFDGDLAGIGATMKTVDTFLEMGDKL